MFFNIPTFGFSLSSFCFLYGFFDNVYGRGKFFNSFWINTNAKNIQDPRILENYIIEQKIRKETDSYNSNYQTDKRLERIMDQVLRNNSELKDLREG